MLRNKLSTLCLIAAAATILFTLVPPRDASAPGRQATARQTPFFTPQNTPAPSEKAVLPSPSAAPSASLSASPSALSPAPTLPPVVPRSEILALQAENPDAMGYIVIAGTRVDYPVVHSDDPEYYLTHDFDKKESSKGAIFLDAALSPGQLTRHTLIHGHNMKDGSMFGELSLYKNPNFLNDHPEIKYETLYYELTFDIFSVYLADVSEKIPLSFETDDDFVEYAQSVAARSLIALEAVAPFCESDVLLTLNTCAYEFMGAHLIVCARLRRDVSKDTVWAE